MLSPRPCLHLQVDLSANPLIGFELFGVGLIALSCAKRASLSFVQLQVLEKVGKMLSTEVLQRTGVGLLPTIVCACFV